MADQPDLVGAETMRQFAKMAAAVAALCALAGPTAGCGGKADDHLNSSQVQAADRLTTIAQKAGGDWNKVPAADQQYVLSTFTSGSVAGAKMLILAKSGKFKGGPGAPGSTPGSVPGK